ncbi:MAG: adenine deaminase [Treponema sp.]|jgi:adenine deaminase|nr:adenine deaminase [Treponema sp.]
MVKNALKKLIDVAAGRVQADIVIRGGKIADVYSGLFIDADLAICDGLIAAIGEPGSYSGHEIIDANGQYVVPGFIDSHIHIESSFLSPPELCRLLVPHGACAIIADPHEIVNVCGLAGLDYMLKTSENLPLDIKFMIPSCVPSTPFEHSGATIDAAAMNEPLRNERVLGLGEMMDYEGVVNAEDRVIDKILSALRHGKFIDGHSPGLEGRTLSAYAAGMIHTDHECSTVEEMQRRLERGMYIMLRQGSACHDLENLIAGITNENSRRCLLCSDDLQPKTIFDKGHIDNDLRLCVKHGIDPMTALRMATLNAAECFGLKDRGGFAPGLRADIVLLDNIQDFRVNSVFIKGKRVAENGRYLPALPVTTGADLSLRGSFHVKDFSEKKLAMSLKNENVWVIDIKPSTVVTGKSKVKVKIDSSRNFDFDPVLEIVKIAVVERHHNTGNVGLGLIRGYGIRRGAVAISVAHDSHNIIAAGCSDSDIAAAVKRVITMDGGAALVADGNVIDEMPLPLGGIMSDQNGEWVDSKLKSLQKKAVEELGVNKDIEPLMTLCFMSLPVIPELKITDMGLFDAAVFNFIPLEAT